MIGGRGRGGRRGRGGTQATARAGPNDTTKGHATGCGVCAGPPRWPQPCRKQAMTCIATWWESHRLLEHLTSQNPGQTDRKEDRPTEGQPDKQTDRQPDRQTDSQTDKQTDRQTDIQPASQTDSQTSEKVSMTHLWAPGGVQLQPKGS